MSDNSEMTNEEFIALCKAAVKHVRLLEYIQLGLTFISVASLIAIIAIKVQGRPGNLGIPFGIAMMICGIGITIARRKAKPFYPKLEAIRHALENVDCTKDAGTSTIPLTVGFANLSGEDLEAMVSEDAALLSLIFARSKVVPSHQIPSAEVLFVYAHLNEDGTIQGSPSSGIRQVVQLTNAAIVILASPNDSTSIQKAIALPGPKCANLIFTLDRNGGGFGRFFFELFEKMRDGKDMLSAWVELAPQHPNANLPYAPQTVFVAEGGKLAFPQ